MAAPKYFQFRPALFNLGRHHRREEDWRVAFQIASEIPDAIDCLSLGEEYILSVGAHATHHTLMMDPGSGPPLTIERALHWCGVLSYIFDTPFVPLLRADADRRWSPRDLGHFRRFQGGPFGSFEQYLDALATSAMAAAETFARAVRPRSGRKMRDLDRAMHFKEDSWALVRLPTQRRLLRAIMAYWTGLISVPVGPRFLNFWRAGEAAAGANAHGAVFMALETKRPWPVWGIERTHTFDENEVNTFSERFVNLTAVLRRTALRRKLALLRRHRTPEGVWLELRERRRGKAAHADDRAIEYDYLRNLSEQARDSELMRYVARAAMDDLWAGEPTIQHLKLPTN